ncbi:MAG: hypothetical protein APR54_10320 [Candidatus Cloacimonas sp. SDB]|nr:MAG: hypothetical protein APR54_10320 [Candidatus Cloacimonas sp. SDB]
MSSFEYNEDAAVYKINSDTAVIFTVDFITPIVNDPFTFGEIAAANALSDVFAMGGKPLLALNIVCFPENQTNDLEEIIKGGSEKIREAGAILAGGHSIKDKEPKYGLAVLGTVNPEKIIKNHTPQEGDALILTKPLGTGIISTALKAEMVSEKEVKDTIHWMTKLNNIPESILNLSIHSMTDVTGYGFMGHMNEMLVSGDLVAEIQLDNIPILSKAYQLCQEDIIPGGSIDNYKMFSCAVKKGIEIDATKEMLLYDAQTSGGLLISIAENDSREALSLLKNAGFDASRIVGKIRKGTADDIKINVIG